MECNVLSVILAATHSKFTKLMGQLICGRNGVVSYLDDMLIFHANLNEHIDAVRTMLFLDIVG